MRLGIGSYTYVWAAGVPGFPQPERKLTPRMLVDRAVELGVSVVQIADNLPLDQLPRGELGELAAYAEGHGITLEVGTWGAGAENLLKYLAIAGELNARLVRTVIDTQRWDSLDNCFPAIRSVLPEFETAGVTLAIENHDSLPAKDLVRIVERCESGAVGVCFDTANSLGCGEDIHTTLSWLGDHVVNLHYKDFVARRLPHHKGFIVEGCPAGQGLVDPFDVLQHLGKRSREASVIAELWPPPEAELGHAIAKEEAWARESIAFLRQYFVK